MKKKKKNQNKTLPMKNNKKNKNKSEYIRSISKGHYDGGGRSTLVNSIRIVTHDVAKIGYLLVVLSFFFVYNNFMSHKLVIKRMSSPCPLHNFCVIRMCFSFFLNCLCLVKIVKLFHILRLVLNKVVVISIF